MNSLAPFRFNMSFLLLAGLLFIFSCQSNNEKITDNSNSEIFEAKMEPYEYDYIRMFGHTPSKEQVDLYQKAVKTEMNRPQTRSDVFDGEWKQQGPGNIGGRVNSVVTHPTNSSIIYAGFARGGLWKTVDGGTNWEPLWNDQPSQAVSALALDPTNPDIIYAGSGDVNISGSVFVGDGLYKSVDAGATWTYVGLEETYIIGSILINPTNNLEILVGAMGLPFETNEDRGVYYTNDGGINWTKTLFIADDTGVHDLAFNPDNPNVILAGGWTRFRNLYGSRISGPDSDVYRSTDFGQTWTKIELDTPESKGRTAVCFSQLDPNVAFIHYLGSDSYFGSLWKSTDAGATWALVDEVDDETPTMMGGFGWFFGRIAYLVDPSDGQEKLYLCGVDLWIYDEELDEWSRATPPWWEYSVHADKHAIIKDPEGNILLGTDGGLYRFLDSGQWEDIENIPNNMFYRTEYNPHEPAQYYGGMQDNGTAGGNVDIMNSWPRIFGGDGFQPRFHPDNPDAFYVETQNGRIAYTQDGGYDYNTVDLGEASSDRKNWDMQYIISPHDPSVVYTGTYRAVSIFNDNGNFFPEVLSESLTDSVELISHTISALDESELQAGLLYYGTTDGNVWRTENLEDFESINEGIPDLYITSVKASPNVIENVYCTVSGYMLFDSQPRLYKSTDKGDSWVGIESDLPEGAIYDVLVYPDFQDSILFVATEVGVYATIDAGSSWERLGEALPYIPVYDLSINPSTKELTAGTYGRSINTYPLDSIVKVYFGEAPVNTVISELTSVKIYPNPTSDYLTIDAKGSYQWKLFSTNGELVNQNRGDGKLTIDLQSVIAGTYYLQIQLDNGYRFVQKLVRL